MQLPMGFTHEQFVDGQRAADFLGLPRKTLLNLAKPCSSRLDPGTSAWRWNASHLAFSDLRIGFLGSIKNGRIR
jgi:hypothetical protein